MEAPIPLDAPVTIATLFPTVDLRVAQLLLIKQWQTTPAA
jgi:hypothetical protein